MYMNIIKYLQFGYRIDQQTNESMKGLNKRTMLVKNGGFNY